MVKKVNFYRFFKKKKIIVTGHSGFKGSWLTLWLNELGSKVIGISDKKIKENSFLNHRNVKKRLTSRILDINNFENLKRIILREKPDIIFHLAAQAIVSESFEKPLETIKTNAVGSINVLHAASLLNKKVVCIMVTSDKCYLNLEKKNGYKETDLLGGEDLYSGSKAAAELLMKSYFEAFLKKNKKILFSSVRAGNVIGGGDWSKNRIIPDIIKSFTSNKKLQIKNPNSVRPWQHVIEPLFGYMLLSKLLYEKRYLNGQSFNFGPAKKKDYKVIELVKQLGKLFKRKKFYKIIKKKNFHETRFLRLISSKAKKKLRWKTVLSIEEVIYFIYDWYFTFSKSKDKVYHKTLEQIKIYENKTLK